MDGSITFTSPGGAVLFTVGVPVMYDAEGIASSDIAVSMSQDKGNVQQTEESMLKTLIHELGHALGYLAHSDSDNDLMAPRETEITGITTRDINQIKQLYDEAKIYFDY